MSDSEVATIEPTPAETTATNGAKRGRGRPAKKGSAAATPKPVKAVAKSTDNGVSETNGAGNGSESEVSSPAAGKKRGRKPKASKPSKDVKTSDGESAGGSKRGRGRPKKAEARPGRKGAKRAAKKSRSESVDDESEPTGDDEEKNEDQDEEEEDDD